MSRHPVTLQSRPAIARHPAFAPFCALWLASLGGGAAWMLQPVLLPSFPGGPETVGAVFAVLGGLTGLLISRLASPRSNDIPDQGPAEDPRMTLGEALEAERRVLEVEELPRVEIDPDAVEDADTDRFADLPSKLRSPLDSRTLDEMGSTELLERLAAEMHRYKAIKEASEA